jgi:hypothetical protein
MKKSIGLTLSIYSSPGALFQRTPVIRRNAEELFSNPS